MTVQESLELLNNSINSITNTINSYGNKKREEELLEYNKNLQQQIFEREDTSYSRAVADLLKAGLSPTLLGGGLDSGTVVNKSAPHMEQLAAYAYATELRYKGAQASYYENLAQNEGIRGELMGSQAKQYLAGAALDEARMYLTYGQAAYLGVEERKANQWIAQSIAETESILKRMGLTDAEIEKAAAETGYINVRSQSERYNQVYTMANTTSVNHKNANADLYRQVLEQQLAGYILDNDNKMLNNYYELSFGQKMGTAGSVKAFGVDTGVSASQSAYLASQFINDLLEGYN